jgi:hypothetical protein
LEDLGVDGRIIILELKVGLGCNFEIKYYVKDSALKNETSNPTPNVED